MGDKIEQERAITKSRLDVSLLNVVHSGVAAAICSRTLLTSLSTPSILAISGHSTCVKETIMIRDIQIQSCRELMQRQGRLFLEEDPHKSQRLPTSGDDPMALQSRHCTWWFSNNPVGDPD